MQSITKRPPIIEFQKFAPRVERRMCYFFTFISLKRQGISKMASKLLYLLLVAIWSQFPGNCHSFWLTQYCKLANTYPIIFSFSEYVPVLSFYLCVNWMVAKLGAAIRVRVAQGLKWSSYHGNWTDNVTEGKVNQLHGKEKSKRKKLSLTHKASVTIFLLMTSKSLLNSDMT